MRWDGEKTCNFHPLYPARFCNRNEATGFRPRCALWSALSHTSGDLEGSVWSNRGFMACKVAGNRTLRRNLFLGDIRGWTRDSAVRRKRLGDSVTVGPEWSEVTGGEGSFRIPKVCGSFQYRCWFWLVMGGWVLCFHMLASLLLSCFFVNRCICLSPPHTQYD
jgi:hypothetical protein